MKYDKKVYHFTPRPEDSTLWRPDEISATVWFPTKIIIKKWMWKIYLCCESVMISWPWQNSVQAVDCNKLKISVFYVGRYFLFCFSNYYMLTLWWKGREVTGPTLKTLGVRSLECHPKRWKDKPWTHHLTSLCFSLPILGEMRITLAIHPHKGVERTEEVCGKHFEPLRSKFLQKYKALHQRTRSYLSETSGNGSWIG